MKTISAWALDVLLGSAASGALYALIYAFVA